jgi:16S rRNA processing protein RimM
VETMAEQGQERILVGAIAGAHGVRGQVKIKSFTDDPAAVAAYGPVSDESGRRSFHLTLTGAAGAANGMVIARIDGVSDRNEAEALKGLRLYVARTALPPTEEGEFYRADLIGLRAERRDGSTYGRVADVHNYGAGDLLEIARADGETEFLPFTMATAPVVDIPGGRLVVEPPAVVEAERQEAAADGDA